MAGTSSQTPASTDTDLIAPVVTSTANVSSILADKSIQITHVITSVSSTSNTFTEWGVYMQSATATLLSRAVLAGLSHTGNDEISKITTIFYKEE